MENPVNPRVRDRVSELAAAFQAGRPFRHVVIDDFLQPEIAEAMLADFRTHPDPSDLKDDFGEPNPRATVPDIASLGGVWPALHEDIGGAAFLSVLEAISGIPDLRHDPGYFGDGTHESFAGAGLDPHCDFNIHPE